MANSGNLNLILSARIDGGEPHDIGTIELPVITETIEKVGDLSMTAKTGIDSEELERRIIGFAAAVSEQITVPEASYVLTHPPERMIGPALAIDPSPEFDSQLRAAKARHAHLEHPALLDGPQHVITGARQEGKTRLALKWLTEAPEGVERVLVVTSTHQAESLNRKCGFKLRDPRIISYRQLLNQGARAGVQYGIDETVQILTELLNLNECPRLLTVSHAEAWQGRGPTE